jgi:predicted transcriptional regulator
MNFEELLSKLSLSHNTLGLHLDAMAEKGEIMKEKRPSKTRGRPRYFYSGFWASEAAFSSCEPGHGCGFSEFREAESDL